jgi:hypothetical protein
VTRPAELRDGALELREEADVVVIIEEDPLLVVPTREDVVQTAGDLNAKRAPDAMKLARAGVAEQMRFRT